MARTLVLLDDAAQHDAVAAEVAALVDGGELAWRVVAADEDVWQAIGRLLTAEHADVVVLALSYLAGPGLSREVARVFGLPVLWIPFSAGRRDDSTDDGHPTCSYSWPVSGTDVGRVR
jgi:hypothetical protein